MACLGAFALNNDPIAVAGSGMVTIAAALWIGWTVTCTLIVIFRRGTQETANDPDRTGTYRNDNPAGIAP